MSDTPLLKLPYLAAAQSQKHVTHNEALRILDAVVQLAVLDKDASSPPTSPAEGDRYIVGPSATGGWTGHSREIAAWQDGAWAFYAAQSGWIAWVGDESALYAFDGTVWTAYPSAGSGTTNLSVASRTSTTLDVASDTGTDATVPAATTSLAGLLTAADKSKLDGIEAGATADMTGAEIATALAGQSPQNLAMLGVNASADATNRLALSSDASLFNHAGAGHQVKVNKNAATDTASFLFQTAFSGRAEMGTTGDDDFHFKVSADGSSWHEAIVVTRSTGAVSFPNTTLGGGGGGSGEANTASNVNAGGVGVFKQKAGVDLQFRGINAGSSKVTVSNDSANNEIDIDVAESALTLANLGGSIDLGGAKASGTLAAARLPAHTGDVTSSAGSVALTIANSAVTLAKQADVATGTVFYRKTAGSGAPEVQALATLKSDLGLSGTNSGDQTITLTGDVTGAGTGSLAATIASLAVTYAKIQNVSATSRLLGRASAGAGSIEELTAAQVKTILAIASSDVSGLGALATLSSVDLSGSQATGTLAAGRFPALSGDVTTTAGSLATVLATVNADVGAFGSATAVPVVTVNAKGLVTAVATATVNDTSKLPLSGGTLTGALTLAADPTANLQPATKQYVDSGLVGALLFQGSWDASAGTFPGSGSQKKGWFYKVSVAGTVGGVSFSVGDDVFALVDNASTTTYAANWLKIEGTITSGEVTAALGFTPANAASLAASATTDTTNASNISSGTLAAGRLPSFGSGDVSFAAAGGAGTIAASAVTNAKLASMAAGTFKGNNTGGTAAPLDLTAAQVKTALAIASTDVSGLGSLATASSVSLTTQATGTLQAAQEPAHTGDVTNTAGSLALTIAANAVTNAKLAQIATATFKGRTTAGTGNVEDLTASQATALLSNFAGDSGSGGSKGLVPAPAAGDAAANKFLSAAGSWASPPGAGGGEANTASNQGAGGVGVYKTKVGVDLQFKTINAGSSKITVTDDTANNEIDIDIAEANLSTFSSGAKGVVPASGGGSTNFLRADGTWAAPAGGGGGTWTTVLKTTTESRTSTTTLAADSTLKVTMAASTRYAIRGKVFFDTGAAEDFKWRHAGPASPTLVRIKRSSIAAAGTSVANLLVDSAYSAADVAVTGTGTTGGWVEFEGIVANGANAGDFQFQWAQNTSGANAASVLAGSYLEYAVV